MVVCVAYWLRCLIYGVVDWCGGLRHLLVLVYVVVILLFEFGYWFACLLIWVSSCWFVVLRVCFVGCVDCLDCWWLLYYVLG